MCQKLKVSFICYICHVFEMYTWEADWMNKTWVIWSWYNGPNTGIYKGKKTWLQKPSKEKHRDTQTEGRGWTSYMLKINMKLETGLKPYQKKEKVTLITRKRRQRYTKIKPETINDHTWNTEMKKVKMEVMLSIFMCVLYENTTTCNQKWTLEERRVNKC